MPPPRVRAASALLVLALLCTPGSAPAFERDLARSLAEGHFSHLYAFNLVAAYESSHGDEHATFVVARRVAGDRAELLMQLRDASQLARERAPLTESWALLMVTQRGRSDDLMVYAPPLRRVRRLAAPELQRQPVFRLLHLGDLRPILAGELDYRFLSRGKRGFTIEGRPVEPRPDFDRVELRLRRGAALAERTAFFRDGEELRRVRIDPREVIDYQGRQLPGLMRVTTPDGGITVIRLRNALVDPLLPEELFTEHNLWIQRFPLL